MQCFPIQFYSAFSKYNICCKLAAAEILQTALMTNLQQCDIDSTQKNRYQHSTNIIPIIK